MRSLTAHLGNDYVRVRIGIGHPGAKELVTHWVLHNFAKSDRDWLEPLLGAIAKAAPDLAEGANDKFQSFVAHAMHMEARLARSGPSPPRASAKMRRAPRAKSLPPQPRAPSASFAAGSALVMDFASMGFKCGIVGLPNVGKSTLFNALTETAAAAAANYPFCTIEPNVGEVPVPDTRLDTLAKIAKSAEIIPTRLTFVDIAGLVRGASKGEGLGNQFLAVIREVDAIAYVLRCFEDDDIIHVEGRVDPIADAETIETELMLADLDSLEKRIPTLERRVRGQDKEAKKTLELVERVLRPCCARASRRGLRKSPTRSAPPSRRSICSPPSRCSMSAMWMRRSAATGNAHSRRVEERAKAEGAGCVIISAKIEAELAELRPTSARPISPSLALPSPA